MALNFTIPLAIRVDTADWRIAYGEGETVRDIRDHVQALVEEAVILRLAQVANGARLVGTL
jgi:hypothetical protein